MVKGCIVSPLLGKEANLEQAKEKDEQIVAILEKWQIPYTVISPWETDKVALDLKVR